MQILLLNDRIEIAFGGGTLLTNSLSFSETTTTYTVRRSLGYLDCAGVLTKLLLGREFKPRRGTFSQFHQKSNAL